MNEQELTRARGPPRSPFSTTSPNYYLIRHNLATCGLSGDIDLQGWVIVDVRDISDLELNVNKVAHKLRLAKALLDMGENVCVRCAAGLNRSNAIALGTLVLIDPRGSIEESVRYHEAQMGKRAWIAPQLLRTVQKALFLLKNKG